MTKVLVLLAEGFEESEAIVPIDVWRRSGFEVVTMALHGTFVTSSHHIVVHADLSFDPEIDFDVLFLPGGGVGTVGSVQNASTARAERRAQQHTHRRGAPVPNTHPQPKQSTATVMRVNRPN